MPRALDRKVADTRSTSQVMGSDAAYLVPRLSMTDDDDAHGKMGSGLAPCARARVRATVVAGLDWESGFVSESSANQ